VAFYLSFALANSALTLLVFRVSANHPHYTPATN